MQSRNIFAQSSSEQATSWQYTSIVGVRNKLAQNVLRSISAVMRPREQAPGRPHYMHGPLCIISTSFQAFHVHQVTYYCLLIHNKILLSLC